MQSKLQIRALALTVGDGLGAYIAIHNGIFEDSGTLKSALKNTVGVGVPMAQLLEDAESLVPLWNRIADEVGAFRASHYWSLPRDEAYYFDVLERYVAALRKTVMALVERQLLLNEGSKGGPNNPMTRAAFRRTAAAYEQTVEQYLAIGLELNEAAPVIFGVDGEDDRLRSVIPFPSSPPLPPRLRTSSWPKIRRTAATASGVLSVLFLLGFGVETKTIAPTNAQAYLDDQRRLYFAPPCVGKQEREQLRRSTLSEAYQLKYNKPDDECREAYGFVQEGRSLSGSVLERIGALPELQSRWNSDGTWNW